LAPPAAPVAQNAPETIGAAPSPDRQQLEAMSLDLAAVRQSVSQLATTRQNVDQLAAVQQSVDQLAAVQQSVKQLAAQQEQITRNITKLHAAEQNILRKITSAAPPGSAPAHARQPRPSQARQAR
jgi:hypothetical protein